MPVFDQPRECAAKQQRRNHCVRVEHDPRYARLRAQAIASFTSASVTPRFATSSRNSSRSASSPSATTRTSTRWPLRSGNGCFSTKRCGSSIVTISLYAYTGSSSYVYITVLMQQGSLLALLAAKQLAHLAYICTAYTSLLVL